MAPNAHRPRQATAKAETLAALVDLLVAHVDRAYITAGQPGALTAVRNMLSRMDRDALTALVYELGLETEPPREEEPEDRRA
jgi:hypothetical protein